MTDYTRLVAVYLWRLVMIACTCAAVIERSWGVAACCAASLVVAFCVRASAPPMREEQA